MTSESKRLDQQATAAVSIVAEALCYAETWEEAIDDLAQLFDQNPITMADQTETMIQRAAGIPLPATIEQKLELVQLALEDHRESDQ